MMLKQNLKLVYNDLFSKFDLKKPLDSHVINKIIKNSLKDFLRNKSCPAIYCGGGHTKMLMADFMFELKKVKIIIDNFNKGESDSGFKIICSDDINKANIDGIILSTFKFKDKLADELKRLHPDIPVLNIYDKIAEKGITLQSDYYYNNHPYHHYRTINKLIRKLSDLTATDLTNTYIDLITELIHIKDFRMALIYLNKLCLLSNSELEYLELRDCVQKLYDLELAACTEISSSNILMLCVDGLRKMDVNKNDMPALHNWIETKCLSFENAYSYSTSTFESLMPVYSENTDSRTEYYKKNFVNGDDCRFVIEARKQKRNVYFYTDMEHFVESDGIRYADTFQTVTEKIWSFILDATSEPNGLFYLHPQYESHFSFSNPYTQEKLVAEGTALLFDFLPAKGGSCRTDYAKQHSDAIHYIDDTLGPFLERLKCSTVFFADHGNLLLEKNVTLAGVEPMHFLCSNDWLRIPFVICCGGNAQKNTDLTSLLSLNDVLLAIFRKNQIPNLSKTYIKIGRSAIYNPDFKMLYKNRGVEKYLLAFEGFVFDSGYKLIVFSDGSVELYSSSDDSLLDMDDKKKELLEMVKNEITVCVL